MPWTPAGTSRRTNTVKFEYVVRKPLTVQSRARHGQSKGLAQSQLHNGTLLAINENYTMTANAVIGVCVHQLDGRVRQRADQSRHAAVHDGDEPDVDGEFCGCDQADVEHL